jgi:hypothetical protein
MMNVETAICSVAVDTPIQVSLEDLTPKVVPVRRIVATDHYEPSGEVVVDCSCAS